MAAEAMPHEPEPSKGTEPDERRSRDVRDTARWTFPEGDATLKGHAVGQTVRRSTVDKEKPQDPLRNEERIVLMAAGAGNEPAMKTA